MVIRALRKRPRAEGMGQRWKECVKSGGRKTRAAKREALALRLKSMSRLARLDGVLELCCNLQYRFQLGSWVSRVCTMEYEGTNYEGTYHHRCMHKERGHERGVAMPYDHIVHTTDL
jgi:hypothetical protein